MSRRLLVLTAVILGGGALGAAFVAGAIQWRKGPPLPETREVTVGSSRILAPTGYLRFPDENARGAGDRIDLAAFFPDFAPAAAPPPISDAAALQERSERTIFLTLKPQEPGLPPADRPARLYARFLSAVVWSHPGGLQMRRFQQGSPYEDEELYIAPPEGRVFFARCAQPPEKPDGLPDSCLTEFRQNGLDVQMRFSPSLLAEWERMMEGARALVRRLAR